MKVRNLLIVVPVLLAALKMNAQSAFENLTFTTIVENPITTVKDQSKSGTCWAFSSIGFFEAELLRLQKKTYDLCESFLIYKTMIDRAKMSVRLHGDVSFAQGGGFYDAIYCLKNYGMCPDEAMPKQGSLYGDTLYNHSELGMIARAYVKSVAESENGKLSNLWSEGLSGLYEKYLGKLPEKFTFEGKEYTPKSFVTDNLKLNPDDYISLTSFTHHPFYQPFALEIPDNWRRCLMYNLPLDEFMEVMDYAIKNGYTFAWGADISEPHFPDIDRKGGVAYIPEGKEEKDMTGSDMVHWIGVSDKVQAEKDVKGEKIITPELRQTAFDNWTTVDDHDMLIYGIAKDQNGKEYFMMKNSWGDYNLYHGMAYISKAYVAYKTINIMLHKDAIPKKIADKLGLK